ncbi:SGT1 protein-domain-containing protein [Paraphysoderma sedebokerense]|nr:SGT1 protein-domain-containing protein [Paraphysoderma sedebokerense]
MAPNNLTEIFGSSHLVSDFVQYHIYVPIPADLHTENERHNYLLDLSLKMLSNLEADLNGYIWHKDSFNLSVKKELDGGSEQMILYGQLDLGDYIGDVWFVVYLLHKISLEFNDMVISVTDSDGEFLLIEAAEVLPNWINPSNSQNRVFLQGGKLHIIPFPRTPMEIGIYPAGVLSKEKAVLLIRDRKVHTEASEEVQEILQSKVKEYPEAKLGNIHRARCLIPKKIAHLLCHNHQLVSSAVEAFYTRDPLTLRACSKMAVFPPTTSVPMTVKFSRAMYAQLMSQRFYPPKPFKLPSPNSADYKAAELGMKLACGFEMLCHDKSFSQDETTALSIESYDFESDHKWKLYITRLIQMGYFKGETSGSNKYQHLERLAKEQYLHSITDTSEVPTKFRHISEIKSLLQQPLTSDELIPTGPEDEDDWMNISEKDFEDMLKARQVKWDEEALKDLEMDEDMYDPPSDSDSDVASDNESSEDHQPKKSKKVDTFDVDGMINSFKSFLTKESGLEGIELENDSDIDDDVENERPEGVSFDLDYFMQIMKQGLDMDIPPAADSPHTEKVKDSTQKSSISQTVKQVKFAETLDTINISTNEADLPDTPAFSFHSTSSSSSSTSSSSTSASPSTSATTTTTTPQPTDPSEVSMESYMSYLDQELSRTNLSHDFERLSHPKRKDNVNSTNPEDNTPKDLNPVDLDYNLLKNFLTSFESQAGLVGPVGTILGSLGMKLPRNEDEEQ